MKQKQNDISKMMNDGQRVLYYFAYGSNLHPVRLGERVPSANLLGVSELGKYRLVFHKKGQDGSSKCNLVQTGGECDQAYGAIYQLEQKHKNVLDRIEGKGYGYRDQQIMMQYQGQEYKCFTYFAQHSHIVEKLKPYHWYKQLVVLGARYLHFQNSYVIAIESIESVEDPDQKNRKEGESLIQEIINYGTGPGG